MRRFVICVALILSVLTLAGCGRSASASEAPPSAESADDFIDMSSVETSARPAAPFKAPVFYQPDAKPTLPNRLIIPSIKADMPVVELGWSTKKDTTGTIFSEWDVADFAAGWHKNSALPGETGNIVLSGHNNIKGAVFRQLDQLKRGDDIQLFAGSREYPYIVEEVLIVPEKYASEQQRRENVSYIKEMPDDRLTLVSCWPRNDNTHRIIVVAKPATLVSSKKAQ
jgi:LPXTG-site transpeptidase (sortase) family protein